MAKASHAQEPSMEEILASIRRIISDEEATNRPKPALTVVEEGGQDMHREPETPQSPVGSQGPHPAPPEPQADVLELSEAQIAEEPSPKAAQNGQEAPELDVAFVGPHRPSPAPGGPAHADPYPVRGTEPRLHVGPAAGAPERLPPRPQPKQPEAEPDPDPEVMGIGEPAASEPLLSRRADEAVNSAFNHLAHTILSSNARTLEDLVKDMMRPMLKSWLDDNLPSLVERMVREEIERVSRGGRR